MAIQFVGLKNLHEDEIERLNEISARELKKIERHLNDAKLIFDIKKYDRTGNRARILINARLDTPKKKFNMQAEEWDITKVTHMIFEKLRNEIIHKEKL